MERISKTKCDFSVWESILHEKDLLHQHSSTFGLICFVPQSAGSNPLAQGINILAIPETWRAAPPCTLMASPGAEGCGEHRGT